MNTQTHQECHEFSLAVCVLASGSKGNATYISNGSTSILIDAGLSGVELDRRLRSRGLNPTDLDAIVVSHEHSDHIQGVGILSRRYKLPVYINRKTECASPQLGNLHEKRPFVCGAAFCIKELIIHPFSISHDAEDPAGFTIGQNGITIGIATDLGFVTSMVKEHLKRCSALILEANHDSTMLESGPYPWHLKQRIKSRVGHLSNIDSKKLLLEVQHQDLQQVVLAHLSETNNTPQKALAEVLEALNRCKTRLSVADQYSSGPVIYLK